MKKTILAVLVLSFVFSSAYAAEKVGEDAEREAHRQEVKAIKDAQRANRKTESAAAKNAAPGFWQKEGERSGLGRMKPSGEWLKNLNPMPFFQSQDERYRARKAAEGTQK